MFDFEWINANLFGGAYARDEGFFDDSELSLDRPAGRRRASGRCSPPSRRGARGRDGGDAGARRSPTGRGATARSPRSALDELERAGYVAARRRAGRRAWRAARLRDPGQDARRGAPRARLFAQPRAHRGRSEGAARRRDPVPAPPHELRFRHDDRLVGGLALAGQRAARPLEFGRGRRWRAPTTSSASARPPSTR